MTVNDAHCHFFSRQFFETLARDVPDVPAGDAAATLCASLGWDPPGDPEVLADRWVAELDAHGVTRAALMASVPGDEASVGVAVARHPDRIVGSFMLDPTRADAADRVRHAVGQLGLRCVCLFPAMHRYRLDDKRVQKVIEVVAELPGSVLFVHCGVLSVGVRKKLGLPSRFDFRLGAPLALAPIATAHPRLPIVIPHFGAGFFQEALMVADQCPNIYLDTSSSNGWVKYHPGLTLVDVFRQAVQVVGPDRLVFGSDSSFFPRGWQQPVFDAQVQALEKSGADQTAAARVLGGTFETLFRP